MGISFEHQRHPHIEERRQTGPLASAGGPRGVLRSAGAVVGRAPAEGVSEQHERLRTTR
jgi:hypothetical protein